MCNDYRSVYITGESDHGMGMKVQEMILIFGISGLHVLLVTALLNRWLELLYGIILKLEQLHYL